MNSWDVLAIAGAFLLVMFGLQRLGRQLEAVSYSIREELQTDQDRKDELLREWMEERDRSPHWSLVLMCWLLIAWVVYRVYETGAMAALDGVIRHGATAR